MIENPSIIHEKATRIFNHLKQAKDSAVIRELNRYIKFCAKMAEAQATVQFLKGCIIESEYPKQYQFSLI